MMKFLVIIFFLIQFSEQRQLQKTVELAGDSCLLRWRTDAAAPGEVTESIASQYPNDRGIERDSNVLFTEMFTGDLTAIANRYTDVKNSAGMSLSSTDVPDGSMGNSLKITNIGGVNDGGHLYKGFKTGFDSTVYIRYYVKYPLISKGYIHHESVRIGGHYPASDFPLGQAGICGLGDRRLSVSYEPVNEPAMDTYIYWGDMKSWNGGGSCYGNDMINGSATAKQLRWDEWMCVELMIKLNNPVTAGNGELKVWQDGVEVGHWGPGFPNGRWENDSWINDRQGLPFGGFRWRTNPHLNVNYIWIEFYDDTSPINESHYVKYSNLVVARKYIGMIRK